MRTSARRALEKPPIPNFEAAYTVLIPTPYRPASELTFTILASPLPYLWDSFSSGRKALMRAMCDMQFVLIRFMELSKSKSLNCALCDTPPLFISMSKQSSVLANSVASSKHFAGLLRSIGQITNSTLESLHSFLTRSSS